MAEKNWHLRKFEKSDRSEKMYRKKEYHTDTNLDREFERPESDWAPLIKEEGYFAARVVEVHKKYAFISPEPEVFSIATKDVWLSTLARKFMKNSRQERNLIAVGDRVLCRADAAPQTKQYSELPQCTVEFRAPRTSKLARLDPMFPDREHVLATNVSQLVIVASFLSPTVKWGLIDRYLVLAEEDGLDVVLVLNKLDLLKECEDEDFVATCLERSAHYEKLGYKVLHTKAGSGRLSKKELTAIHETFKNQISLLSGHSGVGKSSLVNKMKPELVQDVEEEDILFKGRHTTSYASFIKLGIGGYVIDTPGIRSFLLRERTPLELSIGFREFQAFATICKFRKCTHIQEEGCAVLAAVESGDIAPWRYRSYIGILTGASGREGRV
jgi:ribosome biogenesis GTPase